MTQKENPSEKIKICLQLNETAIEIYWKTRGFLAEKYIEEIQCDLDIHEQQLKSYWEWKDFKNKKL
jgi:hypothetical protein